MKTCPQCAEEIQDAAVVCRFCGSNLAVARPADPRGLAWVFALIGMWMLCTFVVTFELSGQILLATFVVAWVGSAWLIRGGLIMRLGGGLLLAAGLLAAASFAANTFIRSALR